MHNVRNFPGLRRKAARVQGIGRQSVMHDVSLHRRAKPENGGAISYAVVRSRPLLYGVKSRNCCASKMLAICGAKKTARSRIADRDSMPGRHAYRLSHFTSLGVSAMSRAVKDDLVSL